DKLLVRNDLPEIRIHQTGLPVLSEMPFPEQPGGARHPAQDMNSVGDMSNGRDPGLFLCMQFFPHLPTDFFMEFTHAVISSRHFQSKDRHAKSLLRIGWINAAVTQQGIEIKSQ